jgi:hypothetical protein
MRNQKNHRRNMNEVKFKTEDGNIVSFYMTIPTIVKDDEIPDYWSLYPPGLSEWLTPVMIGGEQFFDVADDPRASLPWGFGDSLRRREISITSENKDIRKGPITVHTKGPFGGTINPYKPTYHFNADGKPFDVRKDVYGFYFDGMRWMSGGIQVTGGLSYCEVVPVNLPPWTRTVLLTSGTRDPSLTAIFQWRTKYKGAEVPQ